MKTVRILLAGAVAIAGVVMLGSAPAVASGDATARAAAAAVARTTVTDGIGVGASNRLEDGIALGNSGDLRVYPGTRPAARRVIDGRAVYVGSDRQASTIVQDAGEATQILTVIEGASAPMSYKFDFSLSDEMQLVARANGEVFIQQSGVTVGKIEAPWAIDANGVEVPTSYEVRANRLIQKVSHQGAAYPVVADPRIAFGIYAYITYSRSETVSLAGYTDYAVLVTAACGLIVVPPAAVACSLIVGASITNAALAFKNAAAQSGKCAQMRFFYFPPVWGGYAGSSVVNC